MACAVASTGVSATAAAEADVSVAACSTASAAVSAVAAFFWPSAPFSSNVVATSCSVGFVAASALGATAALGAVALLVWQPMMSGVAARRAGLQRNEAQYPLGRKML